MNDSSTGNKPVVLITGASRGVGLGVACLLAAEGVPLLLTARGQLALMKVQEGLRQHGASVNAHACDAADEQSMADAFELACAMGPLGAVFNNAGMLEPVAPIRSLNVADFESHLRTNVTGVLVGIKLALTHRTKGQPLRIVNVSSGAATHGYRSWAAYCSSKAAVNLLTDVADAETDDNVSVVAVAPGVIETRMQRIIRGTPEDQFPDVHKFHELKNTGSLLHPVDAAHALVWLLRQAPMSISGKFVDTRDAPFLSSVPTPQADLMNTARSWFDELEST